ncbi:MAG: 3-methyl-2-oxobutanoate hydroxymethyltransferase [Planctomycetes bacterium]|nr:3-methyl-2-oxobutanoate hydroxymethyltransferase [Planctomycetota bacterium]
MSRKIMPPDLLRKKQRRESIVMTVCYDYPSAKLVEQSEVDSIIVGVSLGKAVLGYEGSVPVTVSEVLYHTKAVRRGAPSRLIISDMPFMSCVTSQDALKNTCVMVKEGGAVGVKIEGGGKRPEILRSVVEAGIPVLGHVGASLFIMETDGAIERGTSAQEAIGIIEDVKIQQEAGVFAILMEAVPEQVMKVVMKVAKVPIISLGSGNVSDGQLLILNEMIGLGEFFIPKCVKKYTDVSAAVSGALDEFVSDVRQRKFPGREHTFYMNDDEVSKMNELLKNNI